MAEYLSPGVYVEEFDSQKITEIRGVDTSTAGFIGLAERGPVNEPPVLITSYKEFTQKFGGYLSEADYGSYRYLPGSVEQFFSNGGSRCYIVRVIPANAKTAKAVSTNLIVEAANEGSWGNSITLNIQSTTRKKMQLIKKLAEKIYHAKTTAGFEQGSIVQFGEEYNRIVTINDNQVIFEYEFSQNVVEERIVPEKFISLPELAVTVNSGDILESFTNINLNPASPNYMEAVMKNSELVKINIIPAEELADPAKILLGDYNGKIVLSGGSDGTMDQVNAATFIGVDNGKGRQNGIQSFKENNTVRTMAVPGITMPEVVLSLISHCENSRNRFAVIDMPQEMSDLSELTQYRNMVDSSHAAMYHPWIQIFDRFAKKSSFFPPSGAVLGVYSRTDHTRGVHKAPANEVVNCTGLKFNLSGEEQDILNPKGINLIRSMPGIGIRIWGARTASSNSSFRYLNIRRLFIYIEESMKVYIDLVKYEPNDCNLWNRIQLSVSSFLNTVWRNGMLAGSTPDESYFINIGPTTMTKDDILNKRLIFDVGIAPTRPAEFIIFRIRQDMS